MQTKTVQYTINYEDVLRYKQRDHGRKITRKALRDGVITPSLTCDICKDETKTSAHHIDYGKPLEITWLCRACHGVVHRKDHELNPDNNEQTPVKMKIDESNFVTVHFTLPLKNYIALQKECKEKNMSISSRIRQSVVNDIPIEKNQLEFNFEDFNNDISQHETNPRIQSVGENEASLPKQKVRLVQNTRKARDQYLPGVDRRFQHIFPRSGANACNLQRA
jgi:hypothetical protein